MKKGFMAFAKSRMAKLTAVTGLSLAAAFGLSACENVASSTSWALLRVIDASYVALQSQQGGVNFYLNNGGVVSLISANMGAPTVSYYGSYTPTSASGTARVYVTATTVSKPTTTNAINYTDVTLKGGTQHTVFLTDNGSTSSDTVLTVLEDKNVSAPSGDFCIRILNQAPSTGDIDFYLVPSGSTLANTKLLATVPKGQPWGYQCYAAGTYAVTFTQSGLTTPKYAVTTSFTSGQILTYLVVDSAYTTDPPVAVVIANDVN